MKLVQLVAVACGIVAICLAFGVTDRLGKHEPPPERPSSAQVLLISEAIVKHLGLDSGDYGTEMRSVIATVVAHELEASRTPQDIARDWCKGDVKCEKEVEGVK